MGKNPSRSALSVVEKKMKLDSNNRLKIYIKSYAKYIYNLTLVRSNTGRAGFIFLSVLSTNEKTLSISTQSDKASFAKFLMKFLTKRAVSSVEESDGQNVVRFRRLDHRETCSDSSVIW